MRLDVRTDWILIDILYMPWQLPVQHESAWGEEKEKKKKRICFLFFAFLFFIVGPFLQALWRSLMADLLNYFTLLID